MDINSKPVDPDSIHPVVLVNINENTNANELPQDIQNLIYKMKYEQEDAEKIQKVIHMVMDEKEGNIKKIDNNTFITMNIDNPIKVRVDISSYDTGRKHWRVYETLKETNKLHIVAEYIKSKEYDIVHFYDTATDKNKTLIRHIEPPVDLSKQMVFKFAVALFKSLGYKFQGQWLELANILTKDFVQNGGNRDICGARCADGHLCRNKKGSCPYHRSSRRSRQRRR